MSEIRQNESTESVKQLEEVMLNALPSLNTMYYDGWILRFAEGYTKRANSVNILNSSSLPPKEKIIHCEEIYKKKNQPTIFKVSPISISIDDILVQRGYQMVEKTNIMRMNLDSFERGHTQAVVKEGLNETWQGHYFELNETNPAMIPYAKRVQKRILDTVLCAELSLNDEVVACGMAVVENDQVGLYDIIVSKEHRRKGYGQDICSSLLEQSRLHGAKRAYIQVVETNTKAVNLYKKLGYQESYDYWYRVK